MRKQLKGKKNGIVYNWYTKDEATDFECECRSIKWARWVYDTEKETQEDLNRLNGSGMWELVESGRVGSEARTFEYILQELKFSPKVAIVALASECVEPRNHLGEVAP